MNTSTGVQSSSNPNQVLTVANLHKSFATADGRKEVLRGLDLAIPAGKVLSLLGANGAGKTTLVNILSTLMLPDSGRATVAGYDVVHQPDRVRELISLTGQFAAIDAELTGRENLIFFARLRGLSKSTARQRADELLDQFRLNEAANQLAGSYSGGMRRRLDIAVSLIVTPQLLFLDEPTTGLDPLSRRELWQTIEQLRDRGVAILLTTQYLDEAERLADTIVILRNGRNVLEGSVAQIRSQFGAQICRLEFDSPADIDRATREVLPFALSYSVQDFSMTGLSLSFAASKGTHDLSMALTALHQASITVTSAQLNSPSLDDVFVELAFEHEGDSTAGATTGSKQVTNP